jgi:AICAR transformylase/IMP cyclohydrolase PurH
MSEAPEKRTDLVPVRRALLSVSDKTGLADFARALHEEFKVELISTGGTARFLRDLGLPVTDVAQVTGFPEMMDGRVKTLHPKIHGGLLALRDHPDHLQSMREHGIQPIDLVCINLYPFKQTIERPGVTFDEAIENIDIGGPSMIRSAAKNHRFVLVVTSPERYDKVLGDLRQHAGSSCGKHRLKQAQRAFAHTAEYDALIARYLADAIAPSPAASTTARSETANRWVGLEIGATTPEAAELSEGEQKAEAPFRAPLMRRLIDTSGNLQAFLNDLLTTQAVVVAGTEAAAFSIKRTGQGAAEWEFQSVAHIRPDASSPEVGQAALGAFRDLIRTCVEQNRDGAIQVAEGSAKWDPQFCLVTLLRSGGDAVAASAVICRAPSVELARRRLTSMQLVAGYFDIYAMRNRPEISAAADPLPEILGFSLIKRQALRYGENPHQRGALYIDRQPKEASVAFATQVHGKELSYINLLDADAALSAVTELDGPAACVVKHATPCGFATAADLPTAFRKAYEGDPLAAFGGIVALNRPVDLPTAEAITSIDKLLEVIVAPSYDPAALELLKTRWKNVRLLEVGPVATLDQPDRNELMLHKIVGGYLVQERDLAGWDPSTLKVVTKRQPTEQELADLRVAWLACKHVKSNAIVIARDGMMLGSGAGQQDRVNACRIAVAKAGQERAKGAVAASDAFFPFPDGPTILLDAGITAIIHPGGSVRDRESIALADQRGAAMVLTGERHFKH